MENFIVRTYRRMEIRNVHEAAGLVETVGRDRGTSFTSFSDLLEILKGGSPGGNPGETRPGELGTATVVPLDRGAGHKRY
jgi:hypothetical protein